jgi:hypothetical protein
VHIVFVLAKFRGAHMYFKSPLKPLGSQSLKCRATITNFIAYLAMVSILHNLARSCIAEAHV